MALVLANRVQETGTANTTVSFTLTGSVTGYQSFAAIGNTNTTYYAATDTSGNWEVGLGTYSTTGPTLTRTTIYASSNTGAAVTFSGTVTVFVTLPSGSAIYEDASGNASALGTITSGTWNASTIGVAYGGTGVTTSSGANSVVLRDSNQNITVNRISQGLQSVTAAGGTTILTVASQFNQALTGTGGQTFQLPDATTLTNTTTFEFNNNATGTLTITNNAGTTVGTVAPGGAANIALLSNATSGGTWDVHAFIPESVTWGTNALALGSTVITGGTWNGGTITSGYGGTGLTTFTGANRALYSTSASALAAGTLPVAAGGTGVTTTPTNGQLLVGNGTNYTVATLGSGTGISTTTGAGTLTINNTGVISFSAGTTGLTPATGTTGAVTLAGTLAIANGGSGTTTAQGAMNAFAGAVTSGSYLRGNGTNVAMSTIQAADVPTLNQNTTGTAANVTGVVAVANGGTGLSSTPTNGQLNIGNGTGFTRATLSAGTGISITNGAGSISIASSVTAVTSVTGTSPVVSSGGTTPAISLASGYGDTQNPYASKTANYFLAAPNGAAGAPTFRAVVAADIPTLNQNTTGSAGSVSNTVTFNNGGAGDASGTTYNGSAARTISYNSIGAPSTTGTNASGTWGISISGNAATATSATTATTASNLTNFTAATSSNPSNVDAPTTLDVVGYCSQAGLPFSQTDGGLYTAGYSGSWYHQIFGDFRSGQIAIRGKNSGTWQAWRTVLDSSNYSSYAPTLTGTGASGTWGISISGNAATATTATNQSGGTVSATTGSFSGKVALTYGGVGVGSLSTLNVSGDITSSRGANQGVIYLGTNGTSYLYADGSGNYYLGTGSTTLYLNGNQVLTAGNYNSYALPLSGGTMTGTIYSGSGVSSIIIGQYGGSTRGYLYNDTSGFGLLGYNGGWAVRIDNATVNTTFFGVAQSNTDMRAPIFYDYSNTAYYVDPASTSNLNSLITVSAISNGNAGLRNVMPGGGAYATTTGSVSGAIVITLPTTNYPMVRFTVKVYTYDGLSFDISCGGHTSSGIWYNTFAYMNTQNRPALNVRFCYGGGQTFVYIGELSATWLYPQVFITDVQVGYSTYAYNQWDAGWSIAFNSSTYNNVSATHTVYPPTSSSSNTNPAYASIYYDANNTAYYVDPASNSVLLNLGLGGVTPDVRLSVPGDAHISNILYMGGTAGSYNSWGSRDYTSSGNRYINANYFEVNNYGYGSTWQFTYSAGAGTASGSWRAPIFYDSDNTGYYVDPASTSNLASVQINGTLNVRSSNALFMSSSNGAYQRADSRDESVDSRLHWYGVTTTGGTSNFRHAWYDGAAYFNVTASGGQLLFDRVGGSGYLQASGSLRSPIFYDSDNTGYYVDPASTSNVNTLNAATSLTVAGNAVAVLQAGGVVLENGQTISSNYTMTSSKNGVSAGPITVATGVTVTIPTGSSWSIV